LTDNASHGAFGIEPGEVITAQIGVVGVVGEHVPHRDQDRVFQEDTVGWAKRVSE